MPETVLSRIRSFRLDSHDVCQHGPVRRHVVSHPQKDRFAFQSTISNLHLQDTDLIYMTPTLYI